MKPELCSPRPLSLILVVALALVIAPEGAAAGEYVVAQCDPVNRAHLDARFERNNGGDYAFGKHCSDASEGSSLQVRSISRAPAGREGRISWLAPAGTRLVAAAGEGRLRRDEGHRARISLLDSSANPALVIARGSDQPGGFERFSVRPDDARAGLAVTLGCESADGCRQSDQARAWIRSLRITLADNSGPRLTLSGSLLAPRWVRGTGGLTVALSDLGSGVRSLRTKVEGSPRPSLTRTFDCALAAGSAIATRLQPCAGTRSLSSSFSTRSAPFRNGSNLLEVCAYDFGSAANGSCRQQRIQVDNAAPIARFADHLSEADPELIAASVADPHSGPAGAEIAYRPVSGGDWKPVETGLGEGTALARVDSSAEPPGRYRFRVVARDHAGNSSSSSLRADGSEQILRFPLRERTGLRARVRKPRLDYGRRTSLRGRLVDAGGRGLAAETVVVAERFEDGADPGARLREVRTGPDGRIVVRLAPGPSRRVALRYAGSRRYLAAAAPTREIAVRGIAKLKIESDRVRAGKRARFRGRIGRAGASIPPPGKVVELQVRSAERRRWRTVRQALHTDSRGRLRTSYSFDRFYSRPVRFEFRLKVTRQAGWPYRAPAHSKPRSLRVIPS